MVALCCWGLACSNGCSDRTAKCGRHAGGAAHVGNLPTSTRMPRPPSPSYSCSAVTDASASWLQCTMFDLRSLARALISCQKRHDSPVFFYRWVEMRVWGLAFISTYGLLLLRFPTPHPYTSLYQSLALPIFFSLAAVSRFPDF